MGDQAIGTINDEKLMPDFYQYEYAKHVMNMQNMQNMQNMLNMLNIHNQWGSYTKKSGQITEQLL